VDGHSPPTRAAARLRVPIPDRGDHSDSASYSCPSCCRIRARPVKKQSLSNFAYLRTFGLCIDTRVLHLERTAHDCGLSHAHLRALTAPGRTADGQSAPALKFGDPRVTALLAALCLFVLAPEGITNQRLRPLVAQLLGVDDANYTPRQMGYDLRRLKRKALIRQVPGKLCYTLTPYGRRMALFLTKVQSRVLRPGLQALDLQVVSHAAPPPSHRLLRP
jgi:hypothetical protein